MDNQIIIDLVYNRDSLSDEEITVLEQELADKGIVLLSRQRSQMTCASCDFFVPFIEFVTSPDFIVGITSGIVASIAWDSIKAFAVFLHHKYHDKKIKKIYPNKTVEEVPNIQMGFGDARFVLPMEVEQEKYEYAVDKFFEYASSHTPDKTTYVWYNEKDGSLITKSEEQTLKDGYKKQIEKSI
ncbi:hypothetical protein [Ruminococcus sp.]|uniref:hypothetical protein n=1 Tax=Ruminococcus sp. TaxID=41978 RepID=UPI0038900C19